MRTLSTCLVCGSAEHRLLYPSTYTGGRGEAHRYFLAQRESSAHGDIRRCGECGFTFTSPQFDEAEYDVIYSRIGSDSPTQAVQQGAGAVATERRYARLRSLIARHVDFEEPFLDFGCGDGSFLRVAGSRGGTGFEVGEEGSRRAASGSLILSGRFQTLAGSPELGWNSQAFVTAFDVFEHLPMLRRDVGLIRKVIRAGGHLFVTVPDIGSLMARAAGARWNMLLLEHLWYFSCTTLDRFLGLEGFRPVAHGSVPYDASVGHVLKRLGESSGFRMPPLPSWVRDTVLPVPAGVLFAAYRRTD